MRNALSSAIMRLAEDESVFFLTGDLGFMALEGVRERMGSRFINTGVAEQNMIGVAAGLAREGLRVFVYSIAPFCYARPFEQIRNDVCMPELPVCLIGNGGGYGYGYMGPTHHALEDCAAMAALGLRVLVPAFDQDIPAMLAGCNAPTYLRLGYALQPGGATIPDYAPWRKILGGERGVVVALGPLAGVAWRAFAAWPASARPSVWAVAELATALAPAEFWAEIDDSALYVIEEHVETGGLGASLALAIMKRGLIVRRLAHRYALGYPTSRYGSQGFHRAQCGLDENGLREMLGRNHS